MAANVSRAQRLRQGHISGAYRDENDRTVEFFFTHDGLFSGATNGPTTGFHSFRGTYTSKGDEITMTFTEADNQKPVGDMAKPETGSLSSDRNTTLSSGIAGAANGFVARLLKYHDWQLPNKTMKKQLIRISILQSSKIMTALYALMGFLYTLIGIPMIIFGGKPFHIIGIIYLFGPIFAAVFGFVFFIIFGAVYNALANWLGGVEFEVKNID